MRSPGPAGQQGRFCPGAVCPSALIMQHFRFNASEMWIILLITAGQNRISAAALLSPLHFYTSPLPGTSQKGSWFSCGLSFVLAAGGAEPLGLQRQRMRRRHWAWGVGNGGRGFLPFSWLLCWYLCVGLHCGLTSVGRV